ncbi:hypothetical protein ACV229_36015 [Burkholderia sp. MR1-5-21]
MARNLLTPKLNEKVLRGACRGALRRRADVAEVHDVADPAIGPGTTPTVVAFACLKIDSTQKSGNKYVVVELANNPDLCEGAQSAGVGPSYGVITPARLVQ